MTPTETRPDVPQKPEPYMGDANSVFTMCYKKSRRHSMRDAAMFEWTNPEGEVKKLMLCRHCRQFVIQRKEGHAEVPSTST